MDQPQNPDLADMRELSAINAKIAELERSGLRDAEGRIRKLSRRRDHIHHDVEKKAKAAAKAKAKEESPELIEAKANLAAWSTEIQRLNAERTEAGRQYVEWQRVIIGLKRAAEE